jgi:hypothetical protein
MTLSPAMRRISASSLVLVVAPALLIPLSSFATGQRVEKHFTVKGPQW